MVFKKLKAALGGGGASVETILSNPNVYPGGTVEGVTHLQGGEIDQDIDYLELGFVAKVEVETDDSEYDTRVKFASQRITGKFELHAGSQHQVPFQLAVPWETPISVINGQSMPGIDIGVRTELEIARALDKGDVDRINVYPLPAQERIVNAFANLGFRFKSSDLEKGKIRGSTLPFYQEIEFYPSPEYQRAMNEIEVTFLTSPQAVEVILEIDRRGGFLTEGADQVNRFSVDHASAATYDWENGLRQHLHNITQKRGLFG